jgi:NhaP-type Na+/H+ or K+/H+ antiporter
MDYLNQMLNGAADGVQSNHLEKPLGIIGFIILLILYVTIGSYMEVKKFSFGHETGVIILLGAMCSGTAYIVMVQGRNNTLAEANLILKNSFEFPNDLFFEVLLPLIIFATGYNMRRQKFFENITNIAKFGLLGTFLTFIFYSSMTYLLFYWNDFLWAYDINETDPDEKWFAF